MFKPNLRKHNAHFAQKKRHNFSGDLISLKKEIDLLIGILTQNKTFPEFISYKNGL